MNSNKILNTIENNEQCYLMNINIECLVSLTVL